MSWTFLGIERVFHSFCFVMGSYFLIISKTTNKKSSYFQVILAEFHNNQSWQILVIEKLEGQCNLEHLVSFKQTIMFRAFLWVERVSHSLGFVIGSIFFFLKKSYRKPRLKNPLTFKVILAELHNDES